MKLCSICEKDKKSGLLREGKYICDDCLNAPQRTRPKKKKEPGASAEEQVAFNKIVVREDDEHGPVVGIPSDEAIAPVTAADIEKAREEHAKDPRKYTPTDERTLKRIGADMVGEEKHEPEPEQAISTSAGRRKKADKAPVKKPRGAARGAKKSVSRAAKPRRANKAS